MTSELPSILQFFGRLHTVALHLPIGFLVIAFLLEVTSRFTTAKHLKNTIPFILFWSMIAAVLTAILGYLLSQEGGYNEDMIWRHKWMGIGTAGLSIFLYFIRKNKTLYLPTFIGLMVLLVLTGHNGGSITHGSDFLLKPFEEPVVEEEFIGNIHDIKVYTQIIQPIFKAKCNSCHNNGKLKGGLNLSDATAIKKGGDNGLLFSADKSLLLDRIHLPLEIEEHMPPKGKKQLTSEEVKLLQWWVTGGAEFQKPAKVYPSDPEIDTILKNRFTKKKSSIESVKIAPASQNKIHALLRQGLKVFPLGNDSPWLEARLSDKKSLSKSDFKNLKKVATNINILDLGNTPFDDQLAQQINSFPNISKLFLDQTNLSDNGFKKINPLQHLEYLNLYGCDITDESIPHLKEFKNLKSLYLWQTKISAEGVATLKRDCPKLQLITGKENETTFASAQLKAPKILADSSIFRTDQEVAIKLNFPWAKIYYTTDGKIPDSTDILYEAPFSISKSTTIKTIAIANGWEPSDIGEKTFIAINKQAKDIRISPKPDPAYKAQGAKSLINQTLGSANFKDGQWLGWQGKSLEVILDFEKTTSISSTFVSCLDNNASWIFFPKKIKIWTSDNGQNFQAVAEKNFDIPVEQQIASLGKFNVSFEPTNTRYVKVFVESMTKNPDWHPAPGKPSWLFVDEIIVE